ncbi:MAG: 2Fe-2S iron-sulfur cluster-binding protein [Candidatus Thermochlorobacter sp.]
MSRIEITVRYGNGKEKHVTIETENVTQRSLQDLALDEGVQIGGACGGIGLCTTCRVQVTSGAEHLPPLTRAEKEFLAQKFLKPQERLACQIAPQSDLSVVLDK